MGDRPNFKPRDRACRLIQFASISAAVNPVAGGNADPLIDASISIKAIFFNGIDVSCVLIGPLDRHRSVLTVLEQNRVWAHARGVVDRAGEDVVVLHIRHDLRVGSGEVRVASVDRRLPCCPCGVAVFIVVHIHHGRQSNLLGVAEALGFLGRFARLGKDREKDRCQDGDDRDNHQEFNERKGSLHDRIVNEDEVKRLILLGNPGKHYCYRTLCRWVVGPVQ